MTVLHTQHRAINRLYQATRMILQLTRLRLHVTVSFLRHHRLFSSAEGLHGLLNPVAWLTIHLPSACWLFILLVFGFISSIYFSFPSKGLVALQRLATKVFFIKMSSFYYGIVSILCEMNIRLLVSRLLCWFFDIARFGNAKPCELLISCKVKVCLQKIAL